MIRASTFAALLAAAQIWTITPPPDGTAITNPTVNGQGQLQFATQPVPQLLAAGSYVIGTPAASAVDAVSGCWDANIPVALSPINGSIGQVWIWNGSLLQSRGLEQGAAFCGGKPVATGAMLADSNGPSAASGIPALNATGDAFSIQSVPGGYTVKDNVTGRYLDGTQGLGAGKLQFTATPFVWTFH